MVSPLMIYNVGLCGAAAEGLARDVGHPSFALVIQQEKKEEKKKKKTEQAEAAQKHPCSRNYTSAFLGRSRSRGAGYWMRDQYLCKCPVSRHLCCSGGFEMIQLARQPWLNASDT